jgi:hypothetical protein
MSANTAKNISLVYGNIPIPAFAGYRVPNPVYVGHFEPRVTYWYHGQEMAHMMNLSWSGDRIQQIINEENSSFFYGKREKNLETLRSHGIVHGEELA